MDHGRPRHATGGLCGQSLAAQAVAVLQRNHGRQGVRHAGVHLESLHIGTGHHMSQPTNGNQGAAAAA